MHIRTGIQAGIRIDKLTGIRIDMRIDTEGRGR